MENSRIFRQRPGNDANCGDQTNEAKIRGPNCNWAAVGDKHPSVCVRSKAFDLAYDGASCCDSDNERLSCGLFNCGCLMNVCEFRIESVWVFFAVVPNWGHTETCELFALSWLTW